MVLDAIGRVLLQLLFSAQILQFVNHAIVAGSWWGNPCWLMGERDVPEVCDPISNALHNYASFSDDLDCFINELCDTSCVIELDDGKKRFGLDFSIPVGNAI